MKMFAGFVCVLFAQDVLSKTVVHINEAFDSALQQHNKYMTEKVKDLPKYDLFNNVGYVVGLNSLVRKYDSTLTKCNDNNTLEFDLGFGFNFLDIVFGELVFDEQPMSAVIRVNGTSVHVAFKVEFDPKGTCIAYVSKYWYEPLLGVTMDSSVPKYHGIDITEKFGADVLPLFNAELKGAKESLHSVLNEMICSPSEGIGKNIYSDYGVALVLTEVLQYYMS